MDEEAFEPLAAWLVRTNASPSPAAEPEPPAALPPPPPPELGELLRDVRLFRARLADALESAREGLVRELAAAVLGRELLLAPADVARIVAQLLDAHASATPVRVRVAPQDVPCVPPRAAVRADPALAPGDVVLELAGSAVDARLGVRLADVLAAFA